MQIAFFIARHSLTQCAHFAHLPQIENFSSIYDIIAADEEGEEIPLDSFADYVRQEAQAHGSTLDPDRFKSLIDKYGIDQDGDGRLSKDEFLDFLRGLIIAAIPAEEVATLESSYAAALAEKPDEPMDETRMKKLFYSLGFDMHHPGIHAVLGNVDANGGKSQSLSQQHSQSFSSLFRSKTRWRDRL